VERSDCNSCFPNHLLVVHCRIVLEEEDIDLEETEDYSEEVDTEVLAEMAVLEVRRVFPELESKVMQVILLVEGNLVEDILVLVVEDKLQLDIDLEELMVDSHFLEL